MASAAKTSISPMLSVRRGARAIEYYKAAFGAEEYLNFSPQSLGGGTVRMVMVVNDLDAVFARAVGAGGKVVSAVEDKEYGWRVGRVVDPFGHHWEIGKPLG
jgi:PhnB protein